jgi:hypothetical protein
VDGCPELSEMVTVFLAFLNMSIHSDTLVKVVHYPHTVYISVCEFEPHSVPSANRNEPQPTLVQTWSGVAMFLCFTEAYSLQLRSSWVGLSTCHLTGINDVNFHQAVLYLLLIGLKVQIIFNYPCIRRDITTWVLSPF